MIKRTVRTILRDTHNAIGWQTNRKIILFESDDWGSIRMPSMEVYGIFLKHGFRVDKSEFNRLDALESSSDLESLFEVLSKHKDQNENHPIFTANTVVANPDFEKIAVSGFSKYDYEPFTHTLSSYYLNNRVFDLYKEGIKNRIFYPQFHGREHLNINRWMKMLQNQDADVHFSFQQKSTYSGKNDYSFMEAFDYDSLSEIEFQKQVIIDGLNLFEKLFGYRSKSFISPCYVWDKAIESTLNESGILYLQSSRYQYSPTGVNEKYKKKYHYMGQSNEIGQRFLIRNAVFEPALFPKSDWIDYTMATIDSAFRWKKPAIVSTHRINYIGSLDEGNRNVNLKLLDQLLKSILIRWPDVEFMTSNQLGDLMNGKSEAKK
ncbi:MAG: hypothetical protein WCJ03_01375 [Bacteroidales bacterium]